MATPKPQGATTTFSLGVADGNIVVLVDAKQIDELVTALDNLPTALRLIGSAMLDEVAEAFRESRGPEGRKWLPIKEASNRAREHPSPNARMAKPLVDTGVLSRSFTAELVDGGQAVSIGTNFGFYVYHQHDPDYPVDKHIMPTRNVLPIKGQPLPASWADEIIGTLEDFLALTTPGSTA